MRKVQGKREEKSGEREIRVEGDSREGFEGETEKKRY